MQLGAEFDETENLAETKKAAKTDGFRDLHSCSHPLSEGAGT